MARGVNKVILLGNLGEDPELSYTKSGSAVVNFTVATNESYTDKDGNEVQNTEWHDVVAWERLAEVCNEHLEKGSQVYVEGTLQTRSWEDSDGTTRYSTEVKAKTVQFLGKQPDPDAGTTTHQGTEKTDPRAHSNESFEENADSDGLPF